MFDLYHGSYPYTVEYEYQVKHNGYIGFPNIPLQGFRESVQKGEITVRYPGDLNLNYLVENGTAEIQKVSSEGRKSLRFIFDNLVALEREELGPPASTYIPRVSISPYYFAIEGTQGSLASWKGLGMWYHKLSSGRQELPDYIKAEVDDLVGDVTSDAAKLKLLYNYMQEKTRYVSVQLGLGGWQPFDAAYVSKNQYGDCKALTNFMMALAEYAGIATYPVLIYNGINASYEVKPGFPSIAFNHVVLMAPTGKDTLWMECTSKTTLFGNIGLSNEDRYALVVKPDGGHIVKTPSKAFYENRQINTVYFDIGKDGSANSSVETVYTGNQQEYVRQLLALKNNTERERWLKNSTHVNNGKFKKVVFSDPKERSDIYKLSFELEVPQFATKTGSRLFIPVNALNRWDIRLPDNDDRKRDVYIPFTFEDTDSTIINIPEGYEIESMPAPIRVQTEYVEYMSTVQLVDARTLQYNRRLALKKRTIPRERFGQFLSTLDQIWKADRRNIVTTLL